MTMNTQNIQKDTKWGNMIFIGCQHSSDHRIVHLIFIWENNQKESEGKTKGLLEC